MSNRDSSRCLVRCGRISFFFSLFLWLFATICIVVDWDWASAITIFPFWCWAIVGLIAATAAFRIYNRRHGLILISLWLATSILFSDNLISLGRLLSNPEPSSGTVLRIVTLNCAGNADAAREVISLKPDVVLLQEIPGSTNILIALAKELFGNEASIVTGYDCAILSHGRLDPTHDRQPPQYVQAMLYSPSADPILITSLRLIPPVARLDLWNPDAWRASVANRRLRRQQLLSVIEHYRTNSTSEILGGDFNTTANDTTLRLLSNFKDAHDVAGRGFGNTMLNSFPIARPDQIWLKKLRVISTRAIKTKNSDHRLVLAELEIPN